MNLYEKTATAIVHTLSGRVYVCQEPRFVIEQSFRMPAHLSIAIRILTLAFAVWVLVFNIDFFHRLSFQKRKNILNRFKNARVGTFRDFVRFYETLTLFSVKSTEQWS